MMEKTEKENIYNFQAEMGNSLLLFTYVLHGSNFDLPICTGFRPIQ